MAGMDDKVLARRQKDLDNFTEEYDIRLEVMTRKYLKDMAPAWDRMQRQLMDKVKKLYEEAGALQDPKKILALQNKAARLEALASQLAQDLKLFEAQQQPFYTGALKNFYEDSYYFTAFGLEQAAKVSVNVPLLTPYHVLGVLANPWLPDKANYSDRIRANTAHLAKTMRETIAQGVAQGWGWNETAHAIKDKAGESYFNAVRLARTEFTRAAAQGATYCYMNNADIMDGKRWNATKDSRTAPKDAANDGKIYDIDYDTTENPGIPGQRIPNHPHCRCLWSPVLSALGVQDKERIARAKPTNDSWGPNYYTKAKNYREYAKEKGLPDLDERLQKDNLKSYLRPGETLADLAKKVAYWSYKGGDIAVARPDWDAAAQQPKGSTTAQDELAATRAEIEKAFPVNLFSNDAEVAEAFYAAMQDAPKEYRDFAIKHFQAGIDNVQLETGKGGSCYRSGKSGVFLDKGDWQNVRNGTDPVKLRRARGTLVHEVGHGLDYGSKRNFLGGSKYEALSTQYGGESKGFNAAVENAEKTYKQMKKDTRINPNITNEKTKEKAIKKANAAEEWLYKLKKSMAEEFKSYGWDSNGKVIHRPEYAGLSDIIDGITGADINSGYGHGKKYWKDHNGPNKEIFANLFELYVHKEAKALDFLRGLFPDILDAFETIVKEV